MRHTKGSYAFSLQLFRIDCKRALATYANLSIHFFSIVCVLFWRLFVEAPNPGNHRRCEFDSSHIADCYLSNMVQTRSDRDNTPVCLFTITLCPNYPDQTIQPPLLEIIPVDAQPAPAQTAAANAPEMATDNTPMSLSSLPQQPEDPLCVRSHGSCA